MWMKKVLCLAVMLCLLFIPLGAAYADNGYQIIGDGNTVFFTDVPDNHWAKNAIHDLTGQGIVHGIGNNKFAPESGVTQEQFAKMLVLTFNAPLTSPNEVTFSDVAKDKWSYTYVETSKDFLTGYANPFGGMPSFRPETNATREDIAVALVRMMGLTDKDVKNENVAYNFKDARDISLNLIPYVSLAAERGLIRGYEDGTFKPQQGITRAETVTLLNLATKQSVTNIAAELELTAHTVIGENSSEVTIIIDTEEGAIVTVDGQPVKMSPDYESGYSGAYLHTFTEEGSKTFTIEATKAGKKNFVQVTAKYEIVVRF